MTEPWTPGPWILESPGVVDSGGTWVFVCPSVPDARLIAAAPEMAEFLTRVHGSLAFLGFDLTTTEREIMDGARALLSRIRGEA